MKVRKRAKPKWRIMRFRKKDHVHNVLVAVTRWIRANKGTAVVIGGIGIAERPPLPYNYDVIVSVTGKKPEKKTHER